MHKFVEELLDTYEDNIFVKREIKDIEAFSTGSLALDVSTGIGGVPKGRFTEIYGPESSGKTTVCLTMVRRALEANPDTTVLYIDSENSLDYGYLADIVGRDLITDNVFLVQPRTAEDGFDIARSAIKNNIELIIIDSLAAMAPEIEIDKPEKVQVALFARALGRFLKTTAFEIERRKIAVVFTNQVRASIGTFIGGLQTPGGFALKHFTSLKILLTKGKTLKDKDDVPYGNFVKFVIKKNKVGMPYRTAVTNIMYGKGINYTMDAISFGKLLGIIKSRGAYLSFEGETLGQGLEKSIEALDQNPEKLDKLVQMCYNIVKGSENTQEEVVSEETSVSGADI